MAEHMFPLKKIPDGKNFPRKLFASFQKLLRTFLENFPQSSSECLLSRTRKSAQFEDHQKLRIILTNFLQLSAPTRIDVN